MALQSRVAAWFRSRKVVFVLALLAAVAIFVFTPHVSTVDDPVYKGKPLSHWLLNMGGLDAVPRLPPLGEEDVSEFYGDRSAYREKFGTEKADAHDALIDLREKAFPLLLQMLATSDHPTSMSARLRQSIENLLVEHQLVRPRPKMDRMQASQAFAELQWAGCDLRDVMPSIKRLQKDRDADVRRTAVFLTQFLERERQRVARMAFRTNTDTSRRE